MSRAEEAVGPWGVLGSPRFQRWSAAVAVARMPPLMAAVALTTAAALFLGDPDRGGTVSSAFVLGMLLLAPVAANRADRYGPRHVLRWQLAGSGAAWLALSWLISVDAPAWCWHLGALVAGACVAGSAGVLRSTLSSAVGPDRLRVASSLDASLLELVVVAAPLVVAAGVLVAPIAATAVVGLVSLVAAAAVTTLPGARPAGPPPTGRPRVTAPLAAWAVAGLAFGVALGAVEVGAVSLVVAHGGRPGHAWIVFAVLALASALGGLLDARTAGLDRRDHRARSAILAGVMAAGGAVTALAPHPLLVLAGVALVGLPTAPLLSTRSLRTEAVADAADRARAFTLVFSAQALGFAAAGLLLTGLGHHGAVLVGTGSVLAATALVVALDRPRTRGATPAGTAVLPG